MKSARHVVNGLLKSVLGKQRTSALRAARAAYHASLVPEHMRQQARDLDREERHRRLAGNDWMIALTAAANSHDIRTVFDVGANEGMTTTKLLEHFPRATVHAFEPHPETFKRYQSRLQGDARVRATQTAVGATVGEVMLTLCATSVMHSLLPRTARFKGAERGQITVPCVTLDKYCADKGISQVDVLKSDTQGFELEVLRGAKTLLERKAIRYIAIEMILVELYEGQCSFEALYVELKRHGYALVGLYDQVRMNKAFEDSAILQWCDGLFAATNAAPLAP